MRAFSKVFIEAVIVGVLLIAFIFAAREIVVLAGYPKVDLPESCSTYNKTHIMEATVFLGGFLFHLICEYAGVNEYYVKNYYV